jgi:hypothetical protein
MFTILECSAREFHAINIYLVYIGFLTSVFQPITMKILKKEFVQNPRDKICGGCHRVCLINDPQKKNHIGSTA